MTCRVWIGSLHNSSHRHLLPIARQAHFSSLREVLTTFVWLYSTWEGSLADARFVDVSLPSPRLDLPCELKTFVDAQRGACFALAETLRVDWRQAFAEQLVDNVQDVYDFFQSTPSAFVGSPLARLLKHFEVRMAHQLRASVTATVEDWLAFIARFTLDDPTSGEPPPLDFDPSALFGAAPEPEYDENGEVVVVRRAVVASVRSSGGRRVLRFGVWIRFVPHAGLPSRARATQ